MRIAIIAPAWFAVPPTRYGGIEWVVSILADGLVDHGHEVTLFAAGDSQTKARLVTSYDDPPSMRIGLSMPDLHHALTCFASADQFDLINDHSGPLAGALALVDGGLWVARFDGQGELDRLNAATGALTGPFKVMPDNPIVLVQRGDDLWVLSYRSTGNVRTVTKVTLTPAAK